MVVLRCTRKMLPPRQARAGPPPLHNLLGDWTANLVSLGHSRFVLCVSERTLVPVVLPARDLASAVPRAQAARESAQMAEVTFAPTANRSVLGSLNEYWYLLGAYDPKRDSLPDISLDLAGTPCGPLGMEFPDRLTLKLFRPAPPDDPARDRRSVVCTPCKIQAG